jgi:hypothetical protein
MKPYIGSYVNKCEGLMVGKLFSFICLKICFQLWMIGVSNLFHFYFWNLIDYILRLIIIFKLLIVLAVLFLWTAWSMLRGSPYIWGESISGNLFMKLITYFWDLGIAIPGKIYLFPLSIAALKNFFKYALKTLKSNALSILPPYIPY